MDKKELVEKLKKISGEVAELSRKCGRKIEIDSPSKEYPEMEQIRIGAYGDGYKEHINMWKQDVYKDGNVAWQCWSNTNSMIEDPEEFNITEKENIK